MVIYGRPNPDVRPSSMTVIAKWETTESEFWEYVADWRAFLRRSADVDNQRETYWGGALFQVNAT